MNSEEQKQAETMIKYLSDKMAMLMRENAALYAAVVKAQTRLNENAKAEQEGDEIDG